MQVDSEHSSATGRVVMGSVDMSAIEHKLDRIQALGVEELRLEWRLLYQSEPPKISRDLLTLALSYRLQEIEHGGVRKGTPRKTQTISKNLRKAGRGCPNP